MKHCGPKAFVLHATQISGHTFRGDIAPFNTTDKGDFFEALIEQMQSDGLMRVPEPLRPYIGRFRTNEEKLEPPAKHTRLVTKFVVSPKSFIGKTVTQSEKKPETVKQSKSIE